MSKLSEVTAVVLDEKFRRESYVIANAKLGADDPTGQLPQRFSVLGEAEPGEIKPHVPYRFWGLWDRANDFGPSFRFNSFCAVQPHGQAGVVAYLQQARHVGRAIAEMLWDEFGSDAVATLREHPELASESVGRKFPLHKAQEAAADLKVLKDAENITIELFNLFDGRGFGRGCVRQSIKLWGADAVKTLRLEPYKALALRGVGWLKADRFYLDLGNPPAALQRQALCLSYNVTKESDKTGSVWVPIESGVEALKQSIAGAEVAPEDALEMSINTEVLQLRTDASGQRWVADIRRARAEEAVARRIVAAMQEEAHWPSIDMPEFADLTDHQREQMLAALSGPVGLLGGRPGCLHGDTPIFDPISRTTRSVADREQDGKPFSVYSLTPDDRIVVSNAERPWKYPEARMIRLTFSSGRQITVTEGHRFWNGTNYVTASDVSEGVRSSGSYPLPSILDVDLLVQISSDLRSTRKDLDYQACCFACSCQGDEQLLFSEDTSRVSFPSQADARLHTHEWLRSDESDCKCTNTEAVPFFQQALFLRSMKDCNARFVPHFDNVSRFRSRLRFPSRLLPLHEVPELRAGLRTLDCINQQQVFSCILARAIGENASSFVSQESPQCFSEPLNMQDHASLQPAQYLGQIGSQQIKRFDRLFETEFHFSLTSFGTFSKYSNLDMVVKADDAGSHHYYDFHVPGYENYLAEGLFHHNTGKSFCLVRLVRALIRLNAPRLIKVMGPTGKSMQRVKELMAEAKVSGVSPMTIHRGLGVKTVDGSGWQFEHDEKNPLDCRFLIIEETSMVGTALMASLLAARPRGCHVLFVGDVNQLSPVDYGSPLRDLIDLLPYGEFREIKRNSGSIVRVCSAIVDQQPWEPDTQLDLKAEQPKNLVLIPASKAVAPQKVLEMVRNIRDKSPYDAVTECQVLVAVNKRSPLARVTLNQQLQAMLNPNPGNPATPFRVGDKVIQLKNAQIPLAIEKTRKSFASSRQRLNLHNASGNIEWVASDEKTLIANGEIGRVMVAEEKRTIVLFPGDPDRLVLVYRGAKQADDDADEPAPETKGNGQPEDQKKDDERTDTGCDLDLAYAITTFKAQGSQFPIVIVCLDEYPGSVGEYGVCSREWAYTSISRAQKCCFLVGMMHTAHVMCQKQNLKKRKTFMSELIQEHAEKAGIKLRTAKNIDTINELW